MPGITEDMILQGAMSADYKRVEKETNEMTAKLTKAKAVTITTGKEKNLKLRIPLEGRDGIASTRNIPR